MKKKIAIVALLILSQVNAGPLNQLRTPYPANTIILPAPPIVPAHGVRPWDQCLAIGSIAGITVQIFIFFISEAMNVYAEKKETWDFQKKCRESTLKRDAILEKNKDEYDARYTKEFLADDKETVYKNFEALTAQWNHSPLNCHCDHCVFSNYVLNKDLELYDNYRDKKDKEFADRHNID